MINQNQIDIPTTRFEWTAALYFLKAGHFLFQWKEQEKIRSKFINQPDVFAIFSEKDSGWLPHGVVRTGHCSRGFFVVYYHEKTTVKIRISSLKDNRDITIPIPPTVLLGIGKNYYIWALKGGFSPEAEAFFAPFPNIYESGNICFGSNSLPEASVDTIASTWKLFFEAPFTGSMVSNRCQKYPKDVRDLLLELDKENEFPVTELVRINKYYSVTLDKVIDELVNEKEQRLY